MQKNGAELLKALLSQVFHVRTGRKIRGLGQFNCCGICGRADVRNRIFGAFVTFSEEKTRGHITLK